MATTPKIRLYGDTAVKSKAQQSLGTAKIRLYEPDKPVLNKFGQDVSNHPFNPLNRNTQFVQPTFPKSNPLDALAGAFTKVLPQSQNTIDEIFRDPLNLKADPKKALSDAWNTIKDSFKAEADNLLAASTAKTPSEKFNTKLKLISGAANIAFSPISALFAAANDSHVIGTATKLLTLPFQISGEAGTALSNTLVDKLPLSKQAKETIKPGMGEIFSLAGQLLAGGAIAETRILKLEKKFGPEDTKTILEQATKVAETKKAGAFPTSNPIPTEVQPQITTTTAPETPKYLYHGTNETVLDAIRKEGLRPMRRGVQSLSKDESYAKSFAKEGITPQGKTNAVLIRTKADSLQGKTIPVGKTKPLSDQLNEVLTKETIPPQALEIYKNGQWQPLVQEPVAKPTKLAQDINTELVSKGFDALAPEQQATFDPITKKATIEKVAEFMKDTEKAKEAIRTGEAPGDFKPADKQVLFNAMEEQALKNNDVQTLVDLAKSPIASELSVTAQTLGASGFNKAEGAVSAIKDVMKAREEALIRKNKGKDVKKVKKVEVDKITESIKKTHTKETWSSFVDSLRC